VENMKIMQLPKSTSQEFFTELSEGKNCICGREIHEEHEQEILDNAEKFLSEQDIGVLNSLKDNLRDTPDYESFDETFEDLQENGTTSNKLKKREPDSISMTPTSTRNSTRSSRRSRKKSTQKRRKRTSSASQNQRQERTSRVRPRLEEQHPAV